MVNNGKKKYNIKNILNNDDEINDELEEISNDIEEIDNEKDNNFDKTIETNSNYGYPKIDDPNLQAKIYAKREFYYYKLPDRPDLSNYKEIEEYRKKICLPPSGTLLEHQSLLSNFINPDTPYKGLLIFHGTGTGKCKRGTDYEYVNGNLIKAQDVWNKYSSKIVIENINNTYGEWSIPLENLNINCYNNNKIIIKPVKRLYREYINSRIREITFENGSKIGITFDHKLYTQNGWTNNLEINDKIAIPRVIYNTNKIKYYNTNETYNLGLNYTNKYNSIENKILHMNKENIKGYLSGIIEKKAYINKNNKEITINNLDYINIKKLEILFRIIGIVIYYSKYDNNKYFLSIKNPYIQELIKDNLYANTLKFNLIKNIVDPIHNFISDLVFIKIVNIEIIEHNDYVYDFEIDEYHNYVCEGILCHNTCAAIAIAEKFKPLVQRYGTQIHILVPGPVLKENWKESFIICTGSTYTKQTEKLFYINDEEKEKNKRLAILNALQFYKIMSYRSFYRKVLGEKIVDKKVIENSKIKISYKKTDEGEYERDISIDRLLHLNNSLLIIDEAHNLTGNSYGDAVKKIIANSTNLKIILLTATPMKNSADEIIELLNFIRPIDSQIERDMIFNTQKNHLMTFKPGGLDYLKNMSRGYVSHLRGGDPITFANKKEMGIKPKGLLFTKIIQCTMDNFQKETYLESLKFIDDSLDRKSEAVANFVFPGLDEDKKKLMGLYGREGLNTLKNQLKNHHEKINNLIAKDIFGLDKYTHEFINFNEQTKNITGAILKKEYLSKFSTKFHKAYIDLEENVFYNKNNNESRTAFIYSNLVKIGIEIYQEILIQNGWFEYNETKSNYQIKDNSICYFCGNTFGNHNDIDKNIPKHEFSPATFVVVTGNSNEETAEIIPENKQKILSTVFNNINNKDGNIIKVVLGSKVMNEGISLKNVKSVHILDVYFNFGRVDQVVARAIRWCSHYSLMNKDNMYPEVKLYKYAITLGNNELSTEENLYYKAEQKYLLIKKVERGLKEVAIDCALFKEGNIFPDEVKEFNKCIKPNDNLLDVVIKENDNKYNICPGKCDFTECEYKCDDKLLITKYYDPERNIYKKLFKNDLDYSTFTNNLAKNEIEYSKNKIKELYMTGYVYNLDAIIDYVKESYNDDKKDLFDNFFVEKALDELIPVTENDFNNYKDIIYDKSHRSGYLIYLDGYYIYQPFDENENVPMYYRTHNQYNLLSKLSLYNYIQNEKKNIGFDINTSSELNTNENIYNFDDVIDYYDNRKEFKFIGIIDKEINRGKTKRPDEIKDVFKIREKRDKILEKKRGTGIPSLKGAVCATSKQKEYLEDIAKSLGITIKNKDITRHDLCEEIKGKLIENEKYSKGKDKMTYIMIPNNHKTLKFPLNLEDRVVYLQNKINQLFASNIKFTVKENKNSINLSFTNDNKISKNDIKKLIDEGWETKDNIKWSILID